MKSTVAFACALACILTAGCGLLNNSDSSTGSSSTPTSPSAPTTSITAFAGTWQSTASTLPVTGCGNLTYTVTPTGTDSANVVFAATCASSISVNGSGSGTLSGNVVTWSASGFVDPVHCPFTFNNNKATIDTTSNQVTIAYTGSVCGIPVSGTDTVKK